MQTHRHTRRIPPAPIAHLGSRAYTYCPSVLRVTGIHVVHVLAAAVLVVAHICVLIVARIRVLVVARVCLLIINLTSFRQRTVE